RAYRNDTLSSAQVFKWHKAFKNGKEDVEDKHRSGRPSTSKFDENMSKVRSVLAKDRRLTVRMIAYEVEMSKDSVHRILTNVLCMRKICAKMVPKNLSNEQKENRLKTFLYFHTRPTDMALCNFLFPKIKQQLKGHHYGTLENVQKAATQVLNNLTEQDFQNCYQEWQHRWGRCVHSQGAYFEGDDIKL
ncbi:hypothetical protein X777_01495, partial [Ooceraea biroi]